ncbi:ABC transporter permease [Acidobacteria bacterium AB60]|nr:ABC transporter permease [Acidobacteria bacterium AB60]
MGILVRDIRFALRQLGRAPSFAITAVLTLALGVGANTAIFSLVNLLLLKPLPVPNGQQIMTVAFRENHGGLQQQFSWTEYKEIRAQTGKSFSDVFAYDLSVDALAMPGQRPDRILTGFVSGNYFEGLELKPAVGRLFRRDEGEVLGHDPVVVLSYDYWRRRFNSDPGVVGRAVSMDGHPMTIVGVAPKGFHGTQSFVDMAAFMPLSELVIDTPADLIQGLQNRIYQVEGRMRPGVTREMADAELGPVAQSLMRQYPDWEKKLAIEAHPETSMRINTGDPSALAVIAALFLSLAGMVLLLACVNVANLVLVRATTRSREMAIRTALGAARNRLFRQMMTESVLLSLLGGALGVVLGMLGSMELGHMDLHADVPILLDFNFDWRLFFYSFGVAVIAGVVVGLVPAVRIARANVNQVLHEGSRGVTGGRHRLRDGLVALQLASSLVLLVIAGLFVRSLTAMQTADLGYRPDHVMNFVVDTNLVGVKGEQARALHDEMLAGLRRLGGVRSASSASSVPFGYFGNSDRLLIDGAAAPANPTDRDSNYNVISPEYFRVMGIDLVAGRGFTDADNSQGRDVAIVSESAAKKFWPGQNAIGRTFRTASDKDRRLEVVGIARDAEFQMFNGGKTQNYFYVPYEQHVKGNTLMVLQVRTEMDPLAIRTEAEKVIRALSPQLPVFQVQTMHEALFTLNGLLLYQVGASLAAVMGGLGLTLAIIGLYGVVSYAVSRRVHEIGLRMALGATRVSIFSMIYRQSAVMIASGLGLGVALALLVAKAFGAVVAVDVWDPATFVTVGAVLGVAALLSCYFPARHAMGVEPMEALRED